MQAQSSQYPARTCRKAKGFLHPTTSTEYSTLTSRAGVSKHQIRRRGISDDGCVLTLGTPGIKVANADDVKQTSTCLYLLVVLLFVDGNV